MEFSRLIARNNFLLDSLAKAISKAFGHPIWPRQLKIIAATSFSIVQGPYGAWTP